ncbi:hypothetical protein FACS1894132_09650 [Clostridia bacterium]|nr:hypothetical protein FACS1894132_09650 [Clostridia bacterium]
MEFICPKCKKVHSSTPCRNCGSHNVVYRGGIVECNSCGNTWGWFACLCGCRFECRKCKSGCYITTAVCTSLEKPDDCYELTLLRNFRDTFLKNQPDGETLIKPYYEDAPRIVDKINKKNQFT